MESRSLKFPDSVDSGLQRTSLALKDIGILPLDAPYLNSDFKEPFPSGPAFPDHVRLV